MQRPAAGEAGANIERSRCGTPHRADARGGLERTAALSLAALIPFGPAKVLPILRMDLHGVHAASTVWDGRVTLTQQGQWRVADNAFLASIANPLAKLLALFAIRPPRPVAGSFDLFSRPRGSIGSPVS